MRRTGTIDKAAVETARQELDRLAKSADGTKLTKQQAVRRLGPAIREAREKGATIEQVVEALTKSGIPIQGSTLKGYLGGGRSSGARSTGARPADGPSAGETPPEGERDGATEDRETDAATHDDGAGAAERTDDGEAERTGAEVSAPRARTKRAGGANAS